jgi:hypothetical protein
MKNRLMGRLKNRSGMKTNQRKLSPNIVGAVDSFSGSFAIMVQQAYASISAKVLPATLGRHLTICVYSRSLADFFA